MQTAMMMMDRAILLFIEKVIEQMSEEHGYAMEIPDIPLLTNERTNDDNNTPNWLKIVADLAAKCLPKREVVERLLQDVVRRALERFAGPQAAE